MYYQRFQDLIEGAIAALNTLSDLASALNNDGSYATTVTNASTDRALLANRTLTGTVSGITKAMISLGSVDNTSDLLNNISAATQTALTLRATATDVTNNCYWAWTVCK